MGDLLDIGGFFGVDVSSKSPYMNWGGGLQLNQNIGDFKIIERFGLGVEVNSDCTKTGEQRYDCDETGCSYVDETVCTSHGRLNVSFGLGGSYQVFQKGVFSMNLGAYGSLGYFFERSPNPLGNTMSYSANGLIGFGVRPSPSAFFGVQLMPGAIHKDGSWAFSIPIILSLTTSI